MGAKEVIKIERNISDMIQVIVSFQERTQDGSTQHLNQLYNIIYVA